MTKMGKTTTLCAGIDTSKHKLDVALDGQAERLQIANNAEGYRGLSAWLRARRVKRVGIEASGKYERRVVTQLRRDGFVVILFQPAQVKAYARFILQRAKNDNIDAGLIAACTAAARKIHAPPDPRLVAWSEQMTFIDQIEEDIARLKNRLETCHEPRIQAAWRADIARLEKLSRSEIKARSSPVPESC